MQLSDTGEVGREVCEEVEPALLRVSLSLLYSARCCDHATAREDGMCPLCHLGIGITRTLCDMTKLE